MNRRELLMGLAAVVFGAREEKVGMPKRLAYDIRSRIASEYERLGIISLPYPRAEVDNANDVVLRNCGGRSVVCLGGRDTRTDSVVGNMKPGDTVVHSTGPNQAAQLQPRPDEGLFEFCARTSGGKRIFSGFKNPKRGT